jgi:hypothetical protein
LYQRLAVTQSAVRLQRLVFALTAKYPRIAVAAPTVLERAIARVYGTMIG